jgi:acyl-CoA synthetase
VRDARLGEKVCLAVVFRAGQRVEPAELLAHLDAVGLSKYDMPEYFLDLAHIPSTPSGKMRKRDLVDEIEQGRLRPAPIRWDAKQKTG